MIMAGMILFLCLLICPTHVSAIFEKFRSDMRDDDYYMPGDVNLGYISNMQVKGTGGHCSKKYISQIQSAHAVLFRINEVNQDSSILPNISIGLVIQNDCWHNPTALYRATKLIPVNRCAEDCCDQPMENAKNPNVRGCYKVAGTLVSYSSSMSVLQSRPLSMYRIPHISVGATADELSDRVLYPYFMRLVPPNTIQIQAIVGTIVAFNWTYISLIGTASVYSRNGVTEIRVLAKKHGICIAYSAELLQTFNDDDYDEVIRRLRIHHKAKVVVAFIEGLPQVFQAVTRAQAQGEFIFFSGDAFNLVRKGTHPGSGVNGLQTYFDGGESRRFEQFEKYYKALSPWAYIDFPDVFVERTQEELRCSMELEKGTNGSCFDYEKIEDLPNFRLSSAYDVKVDAINLMLYALDAMIHAKCPEAFEDKSFLKECINGEELLPFMRNVTFQGYSNLVRIDPNGDGMNDIIIWQWQADGKGGYDYHAVGKWDVADGTLSTNPGDLKWFFINDTHQIQIEIPESVCAKPCQQGEFYIQGELKCCWECRRCRDNERVRDDLKGCTTCPELTWPDQENFTTCEPIPPSYMNWLDPLALGLLGLSAIGLLTTSTVTYVFLKYRQKKVVKGSSIEQMMTIIVALYLSHSTAILLIAKPIYPLCLVQYYSFHLSCTLTFVPLLLKTTRLYRIFAVAERCQQIVRFVSSKALGLFSLTLISIVVSILVVCTVIYDLGERLQMPVITEKFVELVCHISNETLLIPLIYNLLLLLMCAVYGFLTRKLPDNFNESWYIFISVSTTLFVWLAFLPTYSMAFYAYHKSALLGLALILNAAVTAICLFAPKVYAIYYITEDNIKVTNFEGASNTGGASQR